MRLKFIAHPSLKTCYWRFCSPSCRGEQQVQPSSRSQCQQIPRYVRSDEGAHTFEGGQGVVGGVFGVGGESATGDIAIERFDESQVRARRAATERLNVRRKALVQPQLAPPLHRHHVAKPLHQKTSGSAHAQIPASMAVLCMLIKLCSGKTATIWQDSYSYNKRVPKLPFEWTGSTSPHSAANADEALVVHAKTDASSP